jgi:hypothetical protein
VVGTEVFVKGAVTEQVIDGGEYRGDDRADGPSWVRGDDADAGTGPAGSWPYCGRPPRHTTSGSPSAKAQDLAQLGEASYAGVLIVARAWSGPGDQVAG